MGDLGAPDLLLPPGADPHDFALRPSDAKALGDADLVIWVGEGLTPWLMEPLATLAPQAQKMSLLDAQGRSPLDVHDHKEDEHEDDKDDHGHDDHHDHGDVDPHAWLDTDIAQTWMAAIAEALANADPENASIYLQNAADAGAKLEAVRGRHCLRVQ